MPPTLSPIIPSCPGREGNGGRLNRSDGRQARPPRSLRSLGWSPLNARSLRGNHNPMRYAKLLTPLLLVYGCATARPMEVSSGPGPIAKLYAGIGGFEGGGPVCETNSPTGISEIAIEGTGCLGPCPDYTLIVRSDGTATYMGRANTRWQNRSPHGRGCRKARSRHRVL